MTVRHFSVDAYIFLLILNIHLYICFFGLFFFKIKHLLHLYFRYFKYSLFIERRKNVMSDRIFIFLHVYKMPHYWPLAFIRQDLGRP